MERDGRMGEFNSLVMLRRPELATRAAGFWQLAFGGWQLATGSLHESLRSTKLLFCTSNPIVTNVFCRQLPYFVQSGKL